MGEESYRQCLKVALGTVLMESGFDSAQPLALESLTEMLQAFLFELGRSVRAFTELACRQMPLPADILLALTEMGASTDGLQQYAFRAGRKALSNPATAVPAKQTSILHTGDRKKHKAGGIVPENFTEFPDSHSYIRTPTHKQPVTDYESVREKAASQKRDVERALTRFIAKTGKTHSLFNTDDTNLFPLISCDRTMPDQPQLPAYINALLFRDQIFEEDEREFLPKKKKSAEENVKKEEADENDENKEGDDKVKKEESAKEEPESIDNPFLRPPKIPRNSFKNPATLLTKRS